MYYFRTIRYVSPITSLRGIYSSVAEFSVGRSEKQKKKSKNRTAFPPGFQANLKTWPQQLQREIDYETTSVGEFVKNCSGDFTELEDRGMALGNLHYISEVNDPLDGRVVRLENKNLRFVKGFKKGMPVAVCEQSNMFPMAECIFLSASNGIVSLKVLRSKRSFHLKDTTYSILPSTSIGSMQSLHQFLEKDLSHSSVINKDLIDFAYMTKPMPSIHNDRVPNDISEELNDVQIRAVAAALNKRRPFVCVQGPPGTGKTRVVAEIIRLLIQHKQRILICAPTNVAVDNVYNKTLSVLRKSGGSDDFIETALCRVSHASEVLESHDKFLDYIENTVILSQAISEKDEQRSKLFDKEVNRMKHKMMKESFTQSKAVFCTVGSSLVQKLAKFSWNPDVLILDEAAQCLEPSVWAAIVKAKRCILVGDPAQLPTLVKCPENRKANLQISLMERLIKEFPNSNLNQLLSTQYRMNERIMGWSSRQFYNDQLIADDTVRDHRLSDTYSLAVDHPFNQNMILFDTDLDSFSFSSSFDEEHNSSFKNIGEANLVSQYTRILLKAGVPAYNIGVISPYYAQVQQIKSQLVDNGVRVNTVDGFQGQEQEVILFSLVRNNCQGVVGFSNDKCRLNVAVTRAQKQFVVFASGRMMMKNKRLASLYRYISARGKILNPGMLSLDGDDSMDRRINQRCF